MFFCFALLIFIFFSPKCFFHQKYREVHLAHLLTLALLCVHVTCSGDPERLFFKGQINIIAHFPYLGLLKYGNSFQLNLMDLSVSG